MANCPTCKGTGHEQGNLDGVGPIMVRCKTCFPEPPPKPVFPPGNPPRWFNTPDDIDALREKLFMWRLIAFAFAISFFICLLLVANTPTR